MKNLATFTMIVFPAMLLFTACEKDQLDDTSAVNIEITSPRAGQAFSLGDTVRIEANISAAKELHGWEVVIRKKADNSVVFSRDRHTHGTSLKVNQTWVNNVSRHSDMILEVTAALDHSGSNKKTETVSFHCHPN
ncbi:MAG TPA: hypothetical protein PKD70_12540 [Saprospiraceae bacterium]|mgnify:CR=1 FL=1|nr:hypothetical protein [Saprospiraceae bacterium]HMP14702.1 hypothetical protein [Saprospiraceae bacterium]